MKNKAEDILYRWINAVNNRNVENLLALYNDQAILMPTFSNRVLNNPDKIRDYFTKLAERDGLSVTLHEKTLSIQAIKTDLCVLCGIYYWRFSIEEELFSFEARFSYVLDLAHSKPIIHHHSSQIPRMI